MLEVAARRTGMTVGDLLCRAARRCVDGTSRAVPKLRQLLPEHAAMHLLADLDGSPGVTSG